LATRWRSTTLTNFCCTNISIYSQRGQEYIECNIKVIYGIKVLENYNKGTFRSLGQLPVAADADLGAAVLAVAVTKAIIFKSSKCQQGGIIL
jgi:hypothetical protein